MPRSKRPTSGVATLWVPVEKLKIGMWVAGLDRPWLETPFPLQGFVIRSLKDIEALKQFCADVEVDTQKGWIRPHLSDYGRKKTTKKPALGAKLRRILFRKQIVEAGKTAPQDEVPFEQEIDAAKRIYSDSAETLTSVLDDIRHRKAFDAAQIKTIAVDMVGSILRNSNALMWLSQLRNKDDYAYQHSINVCILMLSLGKQLALGMDELAHLGFAGLVQDIGVLQLPQALLGKKGKLTPDELALARSHVELSLALLRNQRNVSPEVIGTVAQHHERYDGSGYPRGLQGHEITLFGSIAGIADCYDAMVSERPYAPALSSFQALMLLYELKGRAFNPGIVERFIQSIGIYPIGSVVEMASGEVGIVVEQRRDRRLKPKLLIVMDEHKAHLTSPYLLDMLMAPTDANGHPHAIKDVRESGAYGIDPAEYYLV